jgi:hypothetical protein
MRKFFLTIAFICFFAAHSYSQTTYSVKGSVADTASNVALVNSSIVILNSKDSTLVTFGRSNKDGNFALNNLKEGKFILLVSYPDYADYVEHFALDASKNAVNFGKIRMILTARLLQEVIVKGTVAEMVIKGDTTEFNAAAFKTEANAKVEDLLKQIPGMQIDKDGKITAQGQTVNKVLVDGEEFFGDDPTLVTKNIRADMVDKVQVYDKKSDQAAFTGIDDGEKTKTINIKLKEDKKSGYFGKAEAGGGNDDFYQGQAMFNLFKGKKKFSAYGTVGNTAKTGLGWEDSGKYGSSSAQVTDEGYIFFGGTGGDELDSFDGRFNGEGIPITRSGGVHYDTKWKEDKQSINLNYKVGSIGVAGSNNTLNQNNLPTGIINSNSGQNFDNYMFRHKLDATYLVKIDSTSELKIMADGTLKNNTTDSRFLSSSLRGDGTALNGSNRSVSTAGDQRLFNSSLLWNKKLRKKGRTISLSLGQRYSNDENDGYLNSVNRFYNTAGTLDSIQNIDQYKTNLTTTSGFNSNLAYTEPLTKTLSVVLNYGLNYSESNSDRRSFNQSATGQYNVLDTEFSNNFDLTQTSNQAGAMFSYRQKKTVLTFGSKASFVNFDQTDLFTNKQYDRNFINWIPQATYQYNFSTQKSLSIRYNGNTNQPNINQIQPIRINTDPLNITLGNPDLDPSFNNSLSMMFNSYKVISDRNIHFRMSYSFTSNAIVNNTITDAAGKNTFQSINLDDKSPANVFMYGYFGRKIPNTDIRIGFNSNISFNSYYNLINSVLNKTTQASYSGQLSASLYRPKKHDFYFGIGPGYNKSQSELQKNINNNGWVVNSYFGANWELPGKLKIGMNGTYLFQQKTQSFNEDFDRFLLNTTLTKSFMKNESLKLQLSGNDLLNQNTGFNRRATSNMITQNSYTTIRRYAMFSVIYDVSKMGGPQPSK